LSRPVEAVPLLTDLRASAERLQSQLGSIRLRWLEGRVAAGLGRAEEALAALEEARRAFATHGLSYDLALVNLDLALLHLERGRSAEVRELARQMLEIFPSQGVYRETLAALRLFHAATASGSATVELLRELIRYVHRAQHDPTLHFEPEEVATEKAGPAPPRSPAR
jgi:tetratricopeptide (TPR) repeat protein